MHGPVHREFLLSIQRLCGNRTPRDPDEYVNALRDFDSLPRQFARPKDDAVLRVALGNPSEGCLSPHAAVPRTRSPAPERDRLPAQSTQPKTVTPAPGKPASMPGAKPTAPEVTVPKEAIKTPRRAPQRLREHARPRGNGVRQTVGGSRVSGTTTLRAAAGPGGRRPQDRTTQALCACRTHTG